MNDMIHQKNELIEKLFTMIETLEKDLDDAYTELGKYGEVGGHYE